MPPAIPARHRLIVALDLPNAATALQLVDAIGDAAVFYKVGLELFAAGDGRRLVDALKKRGLFVFADLKLFDVPETVARATAQIAASGADFLTVHGDDSIMAAAVAAKGDTLKILAVTVLTSLDNDDLHSLGFAVSAQELVLSRARRAAAVGCDGVVSSGLEVAVLRRAAGSDLTLVTPGVRAAPRMDDQKRVSTPTGIIHDGGDYLVVGRPIRDADSPRQAAQAMQKEIAAALSSMPATPTCGAKNS